MKCGHHSLFTKLQGNLPENVIYPGPEDNDFCTYPNIPFFSSVSTDSYHLSR